MQIAYDLLARKAWTRRDLLVRLERRGAPPAVARTVVAALEGKGYVDDRAFARQWAEGRAGRRHLGSVRLRAELRRKGVAPALVDAAVREAFRETDEAKRAQEAARRRLPALARRDAARAPARLRDYLLRRGYPGEIASSVVRQLCRIDESEG